MGVKNVNIVVSWICVFCFSVLCANCLRSLYILFFYEKRPQKTRKTQTISQSPNYSTTTSYVSQPTYKRTSSSTYVSGAVALKEDLSYNSYEQYRKNHKIAR